MRIELTVPEVGESISEVQISQWQKAEGDFATEDEILALLETDKATVELRAPSAGALVEVVKKEGELARVGEVVAYLETEAEATKRPSKKAASGDTGRRDENAERAAPRKSARREAREEPSPREAARRQEAPRKAGTATERPRRAPAERSATERGERPSDRVMPAARRLLAEHGLHAEDVEGTGPGGRILKEDVLRHVGLIEEEVETPVRDEVLRERAAAAGTRAVETETDREEEVVPMTLLRRRIAERLVGAQRTAALLTTFNDVDMSGVMAARRAHQEEFQSRYGVKLGIMSFFIKATIDALKRFPELNAEIRDDSIVYRNYYDISIAVGGGRGLVVPVIRDADALSFAEIELAIQDYATRARENKLKVEELQGGTFTISNGGVYGSLLSTPIVNPPQ
ncbi:MAG TPA: 2-oxo acid dehydrogenase subunit E2, partial [Planctomycetota bacterium]|nr:2-oxo acid dehydrogenase subunit E2 [Planctomycetota bacterium]